MDAPTHFLVGIILAYYFGDPTLLSWGIIILGATMPDLIGEPFYYLGKFKKTKKIEYPYDKEDTISYKYLKKSKYEIPYNFMHSIISLIIFFILLILILEIKIGYLFILAYSTHLVIDLFSHSRRNWGIMPFWPFYVKRFGPKKDWWEWRLIKGKRIFIFNLVTYLIVFILIKLT